jgi:PAS domain S-box-containing protein
MIPLGEPPRAFPERKAPDWDTSDHELVLDIVRQSSMTLWAAAGPEKDYAIRLWGPGAEKIYGYSSEQALGKSYVDLFVNPVERAQAVVDHNRMLETGQVYEWDWAADDLDASGRTRTMLTHCFRIQDPSDGSWLLAELGIDISDFNKASQQLRKVREDEHSRQELGLTKAIGDIGQAVAELGDDGTLTSVVSAIFSALRKSVAGVAHGFIWQQEETEFVQYADTASSTLGPLPFDPGAAWALVRAEGNPVFFDATTKSETIRRLSRNERRGLRRSFALVPLRGIHSGQISGMFAVTFTSSGPLNAVDRERLNVLSVFAGQLLSIARDLMKTRQEGERRLRSETKDLVIRSVLHTMGNGVLSLQGFALLLTEELSRLGLDDEALPHLEKVRAEAAQLADTLHGLRTQLEGPDRAESVCLVEPISAVVQPLRSIHPGITFSVDVDPGVTVFAARSYVHHIVQNVVSNAVQILEETDGGGSIHLRSETTRDYVNLYVDDSGPGVPASIETSLFEEGITRRPGGTGQGLFIARDLATISGGSIHLLGPGHLGGAHFLLRLPLG